VPDILSKYSVVAIHYTWGAQILGTSLTKFLYGGS
jgi:hypothetical protein